MKNVSVESLLDLLDYHEIFIKWSVLGWVADNIIFQNSAQVFLIAVLTVFALSQPQTFYETASLLW